MILLKQSSPFDVFLDKLTGRSVLGDAECHAILGLPGRPVQVRTNRDFVRLGEQVEHASLVVEGLVGCFGQNRDGARQITAIHIDGDMVNLNSVVAPGATSALQALTVSTVIQVPHAALHEMALRYPAIAEAFWRETVADAAILADWTVNVGRRDARSRTAHLLCEMVCRYDRGDNANGASFHFPVTQTHLADMLALTSVHVNRTLKGLKEDRVVQVSAREITVLDWDRLVEIGDFDPAYLQIGRPGGERQQQRAVG